MTIEWGRWAPFALLVAEGLTRRIASAIRWSVVATALLVNACTSASEPSAASGDVKHLSAQGIAFDYPASWTSRTDGWPSSGYGSVFSIIGTQPWGPCAASDINCHYEQKLGPQEITVELSAGTPPNSTICELGADRTDLAGRGPNDPPAVGSVLRVDGRPTLRTDYDVRQRDYYLSSEWQTWEIAAPGTVRGRYIISTRYRGPDLDAFHRQLDALIGSIQFIGDDLFGDGGVADCAGPFPSAGTAP